MFRDRKIMDEVLCVLARQPEYGYRIAQVIKGRVAGLLDGQESLLYPALYQHESDGTVESYMVREDGRVHRYYRLTEKGKGKVARVEGQGVSTEGVRPLITGEV